MKTKTLDRLERLLEGQDQRIRLAEDAISEMRTYWRLAGALTGIALTALFTIIATQITT